MSLFIIVTHQEPPRPPLTESTDLSASFLPPESPQPAADAPCFPPSTRGYERLERDLERHEPLVAKLCKIQFRNREDREDLAANVRLAACRKWANFDPNLGTFGTWIGSIIRSEAASMRKKMARTPRTVVSETAIESALSPEPSEEDFEEAQARLEEIPTPYRKALTCVTILGLSCREAAALLGATESTIRTYVWRARRHLEQQEAIKHVA